MPKERPKKFTRVKSGETISVTPIASVPRKETLHDKQARFVRMIGKLIAKADELGYELTFGDAYRDPRCPYGSEISLHKDRLAVDFNLFKDCEYKKMTEDHRPLGEFWESIGGSWGGRWNDGNHYSLEHNGRK